MRSASWLCLGFLVIGAASPQDAPWRLVGVDQPTYSMIRAMAPPLIKTYGEEGLWDWDRLVLDLRMNPFYVRGDFDGDGAADLAVYVVVPPHAVRGVAVLHGSVDKLRLFTERRDSPEGPYLPQRPRIEELETGFVGEYLWLRAAGSQIQPIPCSELRNRPDCDDRPFTLENEAFEANYLGKSAVLYVWRGEQYVLVTTSD